MSRLKQNQTARALFNLNEELAYTVYEIDETIKLLTLLIEKNKGYTKEGSKIKTSFENLKANMVITTGDNYIASAEKQLREKLGELYYEVASIFTAPSASQLENMEVIKLRFDTAINDFKTLKSKNEASYLKQSKEQNVPFVLKTFNEFVAD